MKIASLAMAGLVSVSVLAEEPKPEPEQQTKSDVIIGVLKVPNAAPGGAVPIPNAAKTMPEVKTVPTPEVTRPSGPVVKIPNPGLSSNEKTITYLGKEVTVIQRGLNGVWFGGEKTGVKEPAPERKPWWRIPSNE
jgi:hypothetical protein